MTRELLERIDRVELADIQAEADASAVWAAGARAAAERRRMAALRTNIVLIALGVPGVIAAIHAIPA